MSVKHPSWEHWKGTIFADLAAAANLSAET